MPAGRSAAICASAALAKVQPAMPRRRCRWRRPRGWCRCWPRRVLEEQRGVDARRGGRVRVDDLLLRQRERVEHVTAAARRAGAAARAGGAVVRRGGVHHHGRGGGAGVDDDRAGAVVVRRRARGADARGAGRGAGAHAAAHAAVGVAGARVDAGAAAEGEPRRRSCTRRPGRSGPPGTRCRRRRSWRCWSGCRRRCRCRPSGPRGRRRRRPGRSGRRRTRGRTCRSWSCRCGRRRTRCRRPSGPPGRRSAGDAGLRRAAGAAAGAAVGDAGGGVDADAAAERLARRAGAAPGGADLARGAGVVAGAAVGRVLLLASTQVALAPVPHAVCPLGQTHTPAAQV